MTKAPSNYFSAVMAVAIATAIDNSGKLVRYADGRWAPAGAPRNKQGRPDCDYFGTTTIRALVDRGRMKFSAWNGIRPVEVEVLP